MKKNTIYILLVWALLLWRACLFPDNEVEYDVLPAARQFFDPSWLPADWYLNLVISYRNLFAYVMGPIVHVFGFKGAVYVGRLLTTLLLSVAFFKFFKAIKVPLLQGLLVLLLFISNQSMVAVESMVGGVEAKVFAYGFVMAAFSFVLQRKYLFGFASAGLALSFHILVGGYALFCLLVALLSIQSWRADSKKWILSAWSFLIAGFWGLWAIISQLFKKGDLTATEAWEVYVKFRVPHHVDPSAWKDNGWMLILILYTLLFVVNLCVSKTKTTRFVAAYGLASAALFAGGLCVYVLGIPHLLRFYWFRFPDVMVPLLGVVSLLLLCRDLSQSNTNKLNLPADFQMLIKRILGKTVPVLFVFLFVASHVQVYDHFQTKSVDASTLRQHALMQSCVWIKQSTPKNAVFLIDPTIKDFYVLAERAQFVSFKHAPQSATEIKEWYKRIVLCNRAEVPVQRGHDAMEALSRNFYSLSKKQVQEIAASYKIEYVIAARNQLPGLRVVYQNNLFEVVKVD